jgi:prepilin-type N-terminal cleavage/methylation domain-containing protein
MEPRIMNYFLIIAKYLNKKNTAKGFTLIELLVVVILMGIMSAIALPNLIKQVEKARVAEAKTNLGVLNRAQQAYYFEKSTFADAMGKLGADLTVATGYYTYTIEPPVDNTEVHHLATPITEYAGDLNIMASAVLRLNDAFLSLVCQGDEPGTTPSIVDQNTCNDGEMIK